MAGRLGLSPPPWVSILGWIPLAHENRLWDWINPSKYHAKAHGSRIENIAAKGTPDAEICFDGVQSWLELKVLHGLTKDGLTGSLTFEPGQREWADKRWKAGGLSFALIGWPRPGSSNIATAHLIPGNVLMLLPESGRISLSGLCAFDLLCLDDNDRPMGRNADTLEHLYMFFGHHSTSRQLAAMIGHRHKHLKPILAPADAFLQGL